MPSLLFRQALRPTSRRALRRYNSNVAEAARDNAIKATVKATELSKKAGERLSRVASTAGPVLSRAGSGLLKTLGGFGGRAAKLAGFIERSIPPTIYYARVGLELSKLVLQGRGLSFPSSKVWEQYYHRARDLVTRSAKDTQVLQHEATKIFGPPETMWQRLRSLDRAQVAGGAVVGVELLGLFTVGEIIGKRKIVGYRGPANLHH